MAPNRGCCATDKICKRIKLETENSSHLTHKPHKITIFLRSSKEILCRFFRIFRHLNSRKLSVYRPFVRKNTLAQRLVQQSLWSTTTETVFVPIKTRSVGYNFNIRIFICGSVSNCLTIGNPNQINLGRSATKHLYFHSSCLK